MLRLPPFEYLRPTSVDEALRMRADAGPAGQFVAGGTDLYPNMKRRQETPTTVVDIGSLPELRATAAGPGGGLRVGAGVRLSEMERQPELLQAYAAVAHGAAVISTPLLRNMGTIGGNLLLDTRCNYYDQTYEWRRSIDFCMKKDGDTCWVAPGSPRCWAVQSSDLAPVMVALGASVVLRAPTGEERTLPCGDLYLDDGMKFHGKRPEELLVAVDLPKADGWRAVYRKVRRRGSFDFPVLGTAVWMRVASGSEKAAAPVVEDVRIVLGAIASSPKRMTAAEDLLRGQPLDEEHLRAAADACWRPARPMDNTDLTLGWRKDIVRPEVMRALREAAGLSVK
jgi:4-hydroxybenzoyl-CoA reductase subunit beta